MKNHTAADVRVLPHDDSMERCVLACILIHPEKLKAAQAEIPDAEAFYIDRHRLVWKAFGRLAREGTEIDLHTLKRVLDEKGDFEKVGGYAFLAGLDLELPHAGVIPTYAPKLRDMHAKRKAFALGHRLIEQALNGEAAAEMLEAAAMETKRISEGRLVRLHATPLAEYLDKWDPYQGSEVEIKGVRSGIPALDANTGGFTPGQLIILAARPSLGKSSLALQVALDAAQRGQRILFIPLEMTSEETMIRALVQRTGTPYHILSRPWRLSSSQIESAGRASAEISDRGEILMADDEGMRGTVEEVAALATNAGQLDLVVIDYLGLMKHARGETKDERIGETTRSLKLLAKGLGSPILLLHQLNRNSEREGREPRLHDLRDSGNVEQDADIVIFIHRKNSDEPEGEASLIVAKCRNGSKGKIPVYWHGPQMIFRELETRF